VFPDQVDVGQVPLRHRVAEHLGTVGGEGHQKVNEVAEKVIGGGT